MSRNSNIQKLLKKLAKPARKVSGKRLTYSWKQRRQRTYIPLSKQERKLLQEKRASARDALTTSVIAARNEAYQAAVKMSKDFGEIHKPSYYYRLILQRTRLRHDVRKLSNWNAFVSKETKRHNEETGQGKGERVSGDFIKTLSERWRAMDEDERAEAVADVIDDLNERRGNQKIAIPNSSTAAFNDTRATIAMVQQELEFLHGRTDTDVLLIAVRSNLDHHNQPFVFYSSDRVASFWETITKKNLEDLALQMEGFCISGVEGLARNHKQELLEAKQRVAALILQKLRAASTRGHVNKMYYVNFEEHITAKFGIVLENWPIQKFAAPGSFSSIPILNVIQSAFEKDLTRFRSMDDGEWEAWMEAHRAGTAGPAVTAQAPAAGTVGPGVDSDSDGVQTTSNDEQSAVAALAPADATNEEAADTTAAPNAVDDDEQAATAAPNAVDDDEQAATAAWTAIFAATAAAPAPQIAAAVNNTTQTPAQPAGNAGGQKRAFADAFVNYTGPEMVKRTRKTRSDKGIKRKKTTGENAAPATA